MSTNDEHPILTSCVCLFMDCLVGKSDEMFKKKNQISLVRFLNILHQLDSLGYLGYFMKQIVMSIFYQ